MNDNIKDELRSTFADVFSVPDKLENNENVEDLMASNKMPNIQKTDYKGTRKKLHDKAKKTIDALFKFYLSESIINEDEYIKQKAYHEQATLGDLMNYIEIANKAITTIMENIDMGDMSPRMFEVLSDALRTSMDLLKMKSMHLIQMEESMKKLIIDKEMYQQKSLDSNDIDTNKNSKITSRGNKKLMMQIQDAIKNENIEEADID